MAFNICSMCGGNAVTPNYAKQVDPYVQQYGTILGDSPQQEFKRRPGGGSSMPPIQLLLPSGGQAPGQQPSDLPKPSPNMIYEPCPPTPPTKIWLIKSSPVPQKSFAIAQPPPCISISNKPIFVPCRPPC